MNTDALVDCLPCGVVTFNDAGAILFANVTLARLLGYQREELEGKHVENLLTVAGRIFLQTHLYPLVRLHGQAAEMFVLMRHRDGTDVGVLLNASRRESGEAPVIDCVVMEVRERRKFEDALLRAKQSAEAANAALAARTAEAEEATRLLEEQAVELEAQHVQLQDQTVEMEMQSEELHLANEALVARGEELERARAAADEANQAKSQFLAVMSHELRTPLNAIGGYVQLMDMGIHGPITDAQREDLNRISRAQRHLLRLINDVLNLARIEAGRVEYVSEPIDVSTLVQEALPLVEPQMKAAQLSCRNRARPGLMALADREKVQQILINLLTNAVKFTGTGGTIGVDTTGAEGQILISVSDSGIGIPSDKLATIFEPFVQVETTSVRRREGSGLGLAISRDLARGMGGDLTATSVEGKGSTFTLSLPPA